MQKPDTSRQAIDDIFRLIRSGQLEQAEQKCSSLLIEYPRGVNIIGLHGAILLKLGHEDDAQLSLNQAGMDWLLNQRLLA